MTIDHLIRFLETVRAVHGGETIVAVEWDSAHSHITRVYVTNDMLVLSGQMWGSAGHGGYSESDVVIS